MISKSLGLIGIGLLGSALAERFLRAGFRVVGHDVDDTCRRRFQDLGGTPVDSASAVAAQCRKIVLSLPTSTIAAELLQSIRSALAPGTIVIDTTTAHPGDSRRIASDLLQYDCSYLDATIAGSSEQTRTGDVLALVGGNPLPFEDSQQIFQTFAREAIHVGPSGSGAEMKLVVNLVLGLHRAVLAEGLSYAKSRGLDPRATLAVLKNGPTYSKVMDIKGDKMINFEFEPQARLAQHLKDVRLLLELGEESGALLPLSNIHADLLTTLTNYGFGHEDNSAIIRAFDSAFVKRS